ELRWEFEVGGWEPGILEGFTDPAGISIQVVEADDRGFARLQAVVTDREQAGWINALLVEQGITVYASGPVQTHLEQWFLALAEGEGGEIRGSRDAADLARDPA
ncbi:MAG TPA: ABC transporter ATP-binding protein, partial [Alicyclobacillus sp.]|nr:ABC transporter ATP-binding protein [Alicyclobacillus sp.]